MIVHWWDHGEDANTTMTRKHAASLGSDMRALIEDFDLSVLDKQAAAYARAVSSAPAPERSEYVRESRHDYPNYSTSEGSSPTDYDPRLSLSNYADGSSPDNLEGSAPAANQDEKEPGCEDQASIINHTHLNWGGDYRGQR